MTVRAPRAVLTVNGIQVVPVECEIRENTHHQADTFGATMTLDGDADEAFWADLASITCTVRATNDYAAGGWATKFDGKIDDVDIDLFRRTVRVTGRDRVSDLLDTKTNEQWQNQTTSEIVTDIAGRVGLTANVSIQNGDKSGLIYKDDYNRESDNDVLWNVLVRLAQREGCAVFIKPGSGVLSFLPVDQLGGSTFVVHYVAPTPTTIASGNFTALSLRRGFAVSKNIKVRVKSYQLKGKKSISSEFSSAGKIPGESAYDYRIPNLTKTQADKAAKNRLDEILRQEKGVQVDMPGDVTLDPSFMLQLSGTGTSFDQSYIISSIVHRFGEAGYRMVVDVRNKDRNRTTTQSNTASTEESTADK